MSWNEWVLLICGMLPAVVGVRRFTFKREWQPIDYVVTWANCSVAALCFAYAFSVGG